MAGIEKYLYEENGVAVALWDTPGFGVDSDEKEEETLQAMARECAGQVDLVLYCIRMDSTRWPRKTDITTIQKMTQVFGPKIWQCCQFVLTFANQVIGLCPSGQDRGEFFNEKMYSFEDSVRKTLMKHANLAEEDVQKVRLVPVGNPHKSVELWEFPSIEDWFINFWLECTCSMRQNAAPKLMQLNKHRMTDVPEDVNSLNPPAIFQHPIPAQYASLEAQEGIEPQRTALECPDPSPMPSLTHPDDQTKDPAIEDDMKPLKRPDSCEHPMPSLTQSDQTRHPTAIEDENSSINLSLSATGMLTPLVNGDKTPSVLASYEEDPDEQTENDEPPVCGARPRSPVKPHNRKISFYRALYRQMKDERSGFLEYIKHYWKDRGETIPVFGHVGGLLEGISQWLECSLMEKMEPDKGMANTCDKNFK